MTVAPEAEAVTIAVETDSADVPVYIVEVSRDDGPLIVTGKVVLTTLTLDVPETATVVTPLTTDTLDVPVIEATVTVAVPAIVTVPDTDTLFDVPDKDTGCEACQKVPVTPNEVPVTVTVLPTLTVVLDKVTICPVPVAVTVPVTEMVPVTEAMTTVPETGTVPEIDNGVMPDIPWMEATLALDVPEVPNMLSNVENCPEEVTVPEDRAIVKRLVN
jgi:hypothetical protein